MRKYAGRVPLATAIDLVRGDATRIPLRDATVDATTIGFGIRNVEQPGRGVPRNRASAASRRHARDSGIFAAALAGAAQFLPAGISARFCRSSAASSRSIRARTTTCRNRSKHSRRPKSSRNSCATPALAPCVQSPSPSASSTCSSPSRARAATGCYNRLNH